nr:hypothetical protein [Candidatus Woesearchaeota archaeon]
MQKQTLKTTIIATITIFLVITLLFVGLERFYFGIDSQNTIKEHSSLNLETKTSSSSVTIDLTPKEFDGNNFYLDIGVNTHTIDLSPFDLKKSVTLELNGKYVNPVSAPTLSGHHNSGILTFKIDNLPKKIMIKIKDIPDIPERKFEWQVLA